MICLDLRASVYTELQMYSPPSTGLSKLSLESMPPPIRSQSRPDSPELEDHDDSERNSEDEEESEGPVQSPTTNLWYNIENLDEDRAELIRELFRPPQQEETPQIVLEWCGYSTDADPVYVFKMHEITHQTIRIGSPGSRVPIPRCSCMQSANPCKHLIWIMDQLAKLAIDDHDPDEELQVDENGFPSKLGSPFARISDFHVDVLADSLHCNSDDTTEPSPQRIRDAREILTAIASPGDPDDIDSYGSALFDDKSLSMAGDLVTRGDLQTTIYRLLLFNNEFFSMFLRLLSSNDLVRDPYRKLQQRVARVLDDLTKYTTSSSDHSSVHNEAAGTAIIGPRNVSWAAKHITRAVRQIQALLKRSGSAPEPWERSSAARVLVWILKTVVTEHTQDAHPGPSQDERNLYQCLMRDDGFVIDTLSLLPDQNQYIEELEAINELTGIHGTRANFTRKLESLIARLRKRSSSGSVKVAGSVSRTGSGAGSKRPAEEDSAWSAKRAR